MEQERLDLEVIAALMELEQPLSDGVREWIAKAAMRCIDSLKSKNEDS
ncbi:hypothetical protein [Vibrio harveyi]|nr:hypothetical protein [Vibrio harveyi]